LQEKPPNAPVQKLLMRTTTDRPTAVQGGLFLPAAPDPDKLELTLARIASVVGENNVGSAEFLDSYRPDTFRMRKFCPPVAADTRNTSTLVFTEVENRQKSKISFRYFRPPLPAYVVFDADRPVKVSWKENVGKVVQASGPWRLSGNWWGESFWQEDAWEVELRFAGETASDSGVYCLAFDALQKKWFMRGRFD
jgi:protein ImuB